MCRLHQISCWQKHSDKTPWRDFWEKFALLQWLGLFLLPVGTDSSSAQDREAFGFVSEQIEIKHSQS